MYGGGRVTGRWVGSAGRALGVALVAGVVLSLPSLVTARVADDIWHRAMLLHDRRWLPADSGPLALYTFITGTPDEYARVVESGFAPWWVSPSLRLCFFRPLSSLLLALDYKLWPDSTLLMHVHSIAWYAAVIAVAAKLYRRLLGSETSVARTAAGVATVFYAIDYGHGLPVGWIANRNAVVATAFALLALLLHDINARPTTTTTTRGMTLSKLLPSAAATSLALALAAGEGAVAILFFFFAHAFFLDTRSRREKARALAPVLLVAMTWAVLYKVGRYGAIGSGVYADPIHSPAQYLENLVLHAPLLLGAELGALPPDTYVFVPAFAKAVFLVTAVIAVACAVRVVRALVRDSLDEQMRRVLWFFVVGGTLSVLPAVSTFPSARLLFLAGFGLVGVVSILCVCIRPKTFFERAYVKWLWIGHAILAPALFVLGIYQMVLLDGFIRHLAKGVPADGSASNKRLILVNAPDAAFAYYFVITHLDEGRTPPMQMLVMSGNARDVRVTRTAFRSFKVQCDAGFYRAGTELLFRDPRLPMPVGTIVRQHDVTITVTHVTSDGTPDEATFDLMTDRPDRTLNPHQTNEGERESESESERERGEHAAERERESAEDTLLERRYVFRQWVGNALVDFPLPRVGETVDFHGRLPNVFSRD